MRLQPLKLLKQCLAVFHMCRVDWNAVHRAHLYTLGLVKVTDALGAFVRVDLVDFRPQENRLVRTLRLAHIAVDAFVGDQ